MSMTSKPLAWVIAGPTASGKTALSLRLAREFGCEILCMDSMQIYRGMDIGTAKPTPEEKAAAPHHLVDIADPREPFTVADYVEAAERTALEVAARGKRPLFVGGTGFYLRALRGGLTLGFTPADEKLRTELEEKAEKPGGKEMLHAELERLDPVTAARLHVNDSRRVIRALEVYYVTGRRFSEQSLQETAEPKLDLRVVCLDMPRETLYSRCDRRVDLMLRDGLEAEVRGLLQASVPADSQAMKAIGYKEWLPYMAGDMTLEQTADEIRKATRHYAKRQLTWMRREPDVFWADPLAPDAYQKIADYLTGGTTHESDQ